MKPEGPPDTDLRLEGVRGYGSAVVSRAIDKKAAKFDNTYFYEGKLLGLLNRAGLAGVWRIFDALFLTLAPS